MRCPEGGESGDHSVRHKKTNWHHARHNVDTLQNDLTGKKKTHRQMVSDVETFAHHSAPEVVASKLSPAVWKLKIRLASASSEHMGVASAPSQKAPDASGHEAAWQSARSAARSEWRRRKASSQQRKPHSHPTPEPQSRPSESMQTKQSSEEQSDMGFVGKMAVGALYLCFYLERRKISR